MSAMFDWKNPTYEMVIKWNDEGINFDEMKSNIIANLSQKGYEHTIDYLIMHIHHSIKKCNDEDIDLNQLDLFHE
tara:strand:- start:199 stop:423 length:225 start_codon:yes stop_codon:yes gene_type:complete